MDVIIPIASYIHSYSMYVYVYNMNIIAIRCHLLILKFVLYTGWLHIPIIVSYTESDEHNY